LRSFAGHARNPEGEGAPAATLEALLKRDRALVLAGLVGLTVIAWAYVVRLAERMGAMRAMTMPVEQAWGTADLAALFAMWAVMMVAMMLPSASPLILLFAAVGRTRRLRGSQAVPTGFFVLGYLALWSGFSALAASIQLALHNHALLSPTMSAASPSLAGIMLLAAGLYQWTPLKRICLAHCRSPLGFLTTEWREGVDGALRMGLKHGVYCVGCCWILMCLLFVAGVMNLLWVATIAAFVLVEKLAPAGGLVGRIGGIALAGWGTALLAGLGR
jgi:predicted metal-binding membrane protein